MITFAVENVWTQSMKVTEKNNFCVILAGGRGQRLWPASRNNYPKQFIDFFGTGKTMLQTDCLRRISCWNRFTGIRLPVWRGPRCVS